MLVGCMTIQNLDLDLEKIVGKNVAEVTKPKLFPFHRTVAGHAVIVEYALYGGMACRFLLTIDSDGRILAWSYPDAETAKKCRNVPLVYAMGDAPSIGSTLRSPVPEIGALRSRSETAVAAPNASLERTSSCELRWLAVAGHVKRWAPEQSRG